MSLPVQRKCLFCDGVYASLDPKKGDGMSTLIYRDTERGQTNLMSVKIVSCNKCNNVQSFLLPVRKSRELSESNQ